MSTDKEDRNRNLTIIQATRHPRLERPSSNTLWRWMRCGIKARNGQRIRLRHVRVGGKLYTSSNWIEQFLEELTHADTAYFDRRYEAAVQPRSVSNATSWEEHERARARLRAQGLI